MTAQGEVGLQEIITLVDTAREYLGPMWVKKNIKAAGNLPLKGIVNRKQLASIHPLGLLFRETDKQIEAVNKGKSLTNASTLLLVAGMGRNLRSLEGCDGFELLIEQLKTPANYVNAALLTEISAHWQKLGFTPTITVNQDNCLYTTATNEISTYQLVPASYTFLPGTSCSDTEVLTIPANFIYSQWWEAWAAEAVGKFSSHNPEIADLLTAAETAADSLPGTIFYLDLPPYTDQAAFYHILGTAAAWLQSDAQKISAVIICIPEHLPHLYVRHTLPVFSEQCILPLPKSLLNTLSY